VVKLKSAASSESSTTVWPTEAHCGWVEGREEGVRVSSALMRPSKGRSECWDELEEVGEEEGAGAGSYRR